MRTGIRKQATKRGLFSFYRKNSQEDTLMSHLKRTQLYDVHTAARAAMVDFGGWEMPME